MKKVKAFLGIGFAGANQEEVFEFEDDVTDEEIEEEIQYWANDYIDLGWEVV